MNDRTPDGRILYPAPERNKGPILEVLRRWIPRGARVLEVASGTGQHAVHFAAALAGVTWQPSEPEPDLRRSIEAWTSHEGVPGVLPPIDLDVRRSPWPVDEVDVVFNANMIHISPWEVTEALMAGAEQVVAPGGLVILYGPYKLGGTHTAGSNEAFHERLRNMDRRFGVRDLDDVAAVAARHGFDLVERVDMPANNQTVVFRRRPGT
ncbi:MAG: DUF938 domain-containing protein [Myxococcota bacterium]